MNHIIEGLPVHIAYPNILLTCINPLNSTLAEQFYFQQNTGSALEQEISNYSDWIYEAERNDELIFAPHAIDSPFQVYACLLIAGRTLFQKNWELGSKWHMILAN